MSWKGMTKAISRLPHQMMAKKTDVTVDEDFNRLEARFNQIVKNVNELRQQSSSFRDAVASMLENQMEGAITIEEIYNPMMGVQQSEEGVIKRRPNETSSEAIQTVQDYAIAMTYCRDEILQELDKLDLCVVQPSENIHIIIKTIQKTMIKRQHKLIDYDRYRTSFVKLSNMADKTPSEDKQVYKLEGQLETATQDYRYLNDMLKQDLMRFFQLASSFITPIQEHFYNIQCRVIGGMYGRIYEVIDNHRDYFVTLEMELEQGYQWRINQRDIKSEIEQIDVLKKGGTSLNGSLVRPENASLQERALAKKQQDYTMSGQDPITEPILNHHQQEQEQFQKKSPPPPPPKPQTITITKKEYVIVLYDLDAQQEGDLSIRSGDRIEIIEKTNNTMDWWKGKINDKEGMFPGNYVEPSF
ncbi:hypothetical protein INT45_008746 [Circinella minor]|uniref:SH3 domain-containing protein n=1 Tax=Circinella minor TaxID=1195481 RepID=A0A8H7VHC7_9FUNG|nr:hypothetical protein INT45_008746 [Circinella minor]